MALSLGSVVINCADLDAMTTFWSAALGLRPGPLDLAGGSRVLGGVHVN
jgi:catechol 2,3-dioxygenase-like lactoylglutathione lyase family enzyme